MGQWLPLVLCVFIILWRFKGVQEDRMDQMNAFRKRNHWFGYHGHQKLETRIAWFRCLSQLHHSYLQKKHQIIPFRPFTSLFVLSWTFRNTTPRIYFSIRIWTSETNHSRHVAGSNWDRKTPWSIITGIGFTRGSQIKMLTLLKFRCHSNGARCFFASGLGSFLYLDLSRIFPPKSACAQGFSFIFE